MTIQNYLEIQDNIVINIIVWDGNPSTWTPPAESTMLIQAITPAIIWVNLNPINETPDWVKQEVIGAGNIGFTWDGSTLITNQPQPI
jgi:hypothetical protein